MTYVGDFALAVTVRHMWNTNAIAGESITRGTNGTISVYKDGGLTQSTTGVTDTEDVDGLTGVHLVAIDTSADGTFYSTGADFEVVLSAAAIDGKTINAKLFSFSINNRTALRPTTAGRTLDVSAGGEAGLDWANVGSPTTTLGLSGTTVKTATDVETDTADIQARIPTALTTGRMNANVGAMEASVITATAIATDAITAAKIAADAIGASELAADAVTEIQAGLATAAALATVSAFVDTEVASILADTDDIQTRLPAALVGGRMDSSVGAMAAAVITAAAVATNAIDADALAADAVAEIVAGVAASPVASVTGAVGSVTGNVGGNVTGSVGSVAAGGITAASFAADAITAAKIAADVGTEFATAVWASGTRTLTSLSALAAEIAAAVWNAVATSYDTALSMGNKLNAAGSAGDPWTTALPGAYGAGTAGKIVGDNVNATIGSRLPTASYVDHTAAIAAVQADTDNIQTRVPAALVSGRIDASVGAMAANVLTAAATNADTGAEIAAAVRTDLAVELARIDAAISSRLATAGYTAPDNATITAISAFIDTEVAAILAAVDTEVGAVKTKTDQLVFTGGRVDASVGAMAANVLTASSLAADAVDEILDEQVGDGTITFRQALRVLMAGMAGELSGAATTTITIRNLADTANVIVATVTADGDRTAVTVTP